MAEHLGWEVAGWKIAAAKEAMQKALRTGVGMKARQKISTGTLTGMLSRRAGETYVADFGAFGSVTLTLS